MTTSTTTSTTTITITNNNNTSLLSMVSLATPISLIFVYMMWSVLGMLMVTGSWYIMYWQLGLRSDQCTHNVNLSKQILDCETESLLTLTLTLEWSDQTDLFNNKLLIFLLICDGLSWPDHAAGKMTEELLWLIYANFLMNHWRDCCGENHLTYLCELSLLALKVGCEF